MTTDEEQAPDESLVRDRMAALLREHPPATTPTRDLLLARYEAGLAWVWFPPGYGGLGVAPVLQTLVDRELAGAGAPNTTVGPVGYMMAGTAIMVHGSERTKRRFLPMIYAHDANWVQLFSEPGAGSDLAGLATRAVRDGDQWVVNGQKVWSSGAMRADWGLLLARTDPDVAKHNGMTAFIVDMHAPGVEVRPLRNMTGTAEFAETFMTDVVIPDEDRLGQPGDGWRVALTTLMTERVNFTAEFAGAGAPRADQTMSAATGLVRQVAGDGARRDRYMKVWVDFEVNRLHVLRSMQAIREGTPGPEGSIGKLMSTELTKRVASLAVELAGASGMVLPGPYPSPGTSLSESERADPRFDLLASPSNTIMGGTSEIQRNNIGERVLGLPREPRVDHDVPWKDIPRS